MTRPDVQALLDLLPAATGAPTLQTIRDNMRAFAALADLPEPPLATARELSTAPVRSLLLDPREQREPGPVVVWFHGGGFVSGGIDTHRAFAADVAQRLDLPVVLVDYRLAPEAPYPAAVDDAEEIARWLATNPAELGREVTGLVIGGDSAGGTMTIVTAMALRDRPAPVPVLAQVVLYPGTDLTADYPSQEEFATGYMLTTESRQFYYDCYDPVRTDVRASPLLGDLAGLPPAVVLTAGLDPVRDEGRAYAAGLITAGVPTSYIEAVGNIHAFVVMRKAVPSSVTDIERALTALRAHLVVQNWQIAAFSLTPRLVQSSVRVVCGPTPGGKTMRHPAVAVLSTTLLLLSAFATTAAAQPITSNDAFNSLTAESHPDWMAGLPAQTGLGALTIPGTHDTLAIHGGLAPWAYEAQEDHGDSAATLDAQLNAGVRAIDIRVRVVNSNTAFAIHHTDVYQNANFDDVLTHARTFLSAHPGETVLMDLHGECDGDSTEGGSGSGSIGHCADDPSNITQADRVRIFNDYVSRYPGLFYAPTVTGNSTADMPTVGQARGHIVLTTFSGPRGQVYGGYGLTQLTTGNWGQYVENDWTQCNVDSKFGEAQANMANANTSSAMYTTYLSASCAPFGASPEDMAKGENPKAVDYLNSGATNHVGVVLTDFPGHALIAALIRQQSGLLSGPVPSGLAGKCLDDYNSSTTPGATVDLWDCNGTGAQQWTVMPDRTLRTAGLCLDVIGGGTTNGTHVQLWTCGGGNNQQWTSGPNGSLVGVQSGKCLDDPGAATNNGSQLIIWDCNAGTNQRWTLP